MTPDDIAFISEVVGKRSGLVLTPDKGYLLESRLTPLARQEGFDSLEALVRALRHKRDEKLMWAVTDALTTNETFFFRDKTPFDQFRDDVLPALAASRDTLRVWCAACSTGQEPYSLAMLMSEAQARYPKLKLDILATDISDRVIQKAQAGIYSKFEVQRGLPITHLLKFFDQTDDTWRIKPALRQSIRWRNFNLLEDPRALGRFDVVFCRNVLIYFDPPTKKGVLERIAGVTAPDGYLFMGAAETVLGITDAFQSVPSKRGLYSRTSERKAA
jgi:chemotaxis protein methyltransferase CheR